MPKNHKQAKCVLIEPVSSSLWEVVVSPCLEVVTLRLTVFMDHSVSVENP